jgi:hypothetical protein
MTDPDVTMHRIESLFPEDGYVLLTARRKMGKSTMVGNLIRALVTGDRFLGEFKVHGKQRVALIDLEMSPNQHKNWLQDMGIFNEPRVHVGHFRDRIGATLRMLLDDEKRAEYAQYLRDIEATVLIVDPLGPLLRAYGVDENSADVGIIVDKIRALKEEAGISELLIVHHQGKDATKGSRGHSVLEDVPEALWRLEAPGDTFATRMVCTGRDVEATVFLSYDKETRTYSGETGDAATSDDHVLKLVEDNPGLSGSELYLMKPSYLSMNKTKFLEYISILQQSGKISNVGTDNRPKWEAA